MTSGVKIIEVKETGIQYLFSWHGYAGGLTPLLDKDGKPVIKEKNETKIGADQFSDPILVSKKVNVLKIDVNSKYYFKKSHRKYDVTFFIYSVCNPANITLNPYKNCSSKSKR